MIRPTTPAETDALVRLTEATGMFKPFEVVALRAMLDDYHSPHQADGHFAITYEEADAVLGYAYYAPAPMTDRTWELYWLAVRKDRQGKGVGSRLLQHVEADIRTSHLGRVLFIGTGSLPYYERTRQFYRNHGYEQEALLRDYYCEGESMVVFRKALN